MFNVGGVLQNAIVVILLSLAVGFASYGLTMMVRYTDGPLDIFFKFRVFAGLKYMPIYDEDDGIVDIVEEIPKPELRIDEEDGSVIGTINSDVLASLVSCYWCLTTWISLIISLLVCVLFNIPLFMPIIWLAAIGVSGALYTGGSNQ